VVLCILTVFFLGPIFTSFSLPEYFRHSQTWSYFRNIFPLTGLQFHLPGVFNNYTGEKGVNGSLWTLIIEERLYLILALVYFIPGRSKWLVYLLTLIFNSWYLLSTIINLTSFPTINNIAGFYSVIFLNAGALYLMSIEFSKKRSIFLVAGILLFLLPTIYPLFSYLLVIAIPILVIAIANIKCGLNKAGKYGDFTYGIYVFSFPVQQMLSSAQLFKNNPYIQFLVTLVIVFPFAITSWHLLEKRVLRYKNYYF
jgi:peptidoglycan/LPS O-acetylase OafA/YrhL